jgi:hypothetical protein
MVQNNCHCHVRDNFSGRCKLEVLALVVLYRTRLVVEYGTMSGYMVQARPSSYAMTQNTGTGHTSFPGSRLPALLLVAIILILEARGE